MSLTTIILLVAGLGLLLVGGELLVRGAVAAAQRLGVSPLLAGLVIVGFGTSTPELVTSVNAALIGAPGIAIGNVVGSNIANLLLILGISALLFPVAIDAKGFMRDGSVLAAATVLCVLVVLWGELTRPVGLLLIAALSIYVVATYTIERRRHTAAEKVYTEEAAMHETKGLGLLPALGLAALGLVGVVVGAEWLVRAAVDVARLAGLSETVIGLTLVAIGTSLPELATAIVAGLRRHTEVAIGNVIGSNIFNILFILGVTALVKPIPIPPEIAAFDIWAMVAATAVTIFLVRTGWKVQRWEGGLLLLGYAAYLALVFRHGGI